MYYENDPMGNVRFLFSAAGTGIEKYSYDAFGKATITSWSDVARGTSAFGNKFMYGGREYFTSLGLYDMRNRIYDPAIGRFYQTDPTGFQGDPTNLYRFCGHNPLLGGDPTGLGENDPFDGGSGDSDPTRTFYSGYGSSYFGSGSGSWWDAPTESSSNNFGDVILSALGAAGNLLLQGTHQDLNYINRTFFDPLNSLTQGLLDVVGTAADKAVPGAGAPTKNVLVIGSFFVGAGEERFIGSALARTNLAVDSTSSLSVELYHYTTLENAASISARGLLPSRFTGKVFTTTVGTYTPIEAQMYLALPPNEGLSAAVFQIDTASLRSLGIQPIGGPMRVLPTRNAMGNGTEIIFDRQIPPAAIRRIR